MKQLVVLLLVSLMAASAFAVTDPDPNMIGVYFDTDANDNCLVIGASTPFNAFVVLTNTDAPSVSGYEFGYRNVVPDGMEGMLFRLSSTIGTGQNGLDLGTNTDILYGDHIVGLSAPMVTTPATILHSYEFMLLNAAVTMEMFLTSAGTSSIEGPFPVILNADTSTLFQAGQSTGGPDVAVATVNIDDCVVGVEEASFGSVKSLFR